MPDPDTATASSRTSNTPNQLRSYITVILLILLLALVGNFSTHKFVELGDRQTRDHFKALTIAIAASMDSEKVDMLSGNPVDTTEEYYDDLKFKLIEIKASNDAFRFVYLMALVDDQVIFLADAEPVTSEEYSAPGDVYPTEDVSDEMLAVFDDGIAVVEGPLVDNWGEWISGLAAIRDKDSLEVIAIVGIDIDAEEWRRHIAPYYWLGYELIAILLLIGLMILIHFVRVLRLNKKLSTEITLRIESEAKREILYFELEAKENELRSILRNTPDIVYRLDPDGIITFISEAIEQYGYNCASLLGTPIAELVHPDDLEDAKYQIEERRTGERSTKRLELRMLTPNKENIETEVHSVDLESNISISLNAEGLYSTFEDETNFIATQGIIRDITERKKAESEIHILRGMLPICANCKNIRDDDGYWSKVETYIQTHSEVEFTHSICPDCSTVLYRDKEN